MQTTTTRGDNNLNEKAWAPSMNMQCPHSVYDKDLDTNSLRLLKMKAGTESQDSTISMTCQLSTHALAEAPEYHALSYAWQEPISEQFTVTAPASSDNATP